MRLLIITPQCPYPPEKSGGIHTLYNLLKSNHLHEIDLQYYDEKNEAAEKGIEPYVNKVSWIPTKRRRSAISRIMSLFKKIPFAQYQYKHKMLPNTYEYDAVIYDQFSSEIMVEDKVPSICFAHDSTPLFFLRKATRSKNILAKLYYLLQHRYAARVERGVLKQAKKIMFVSQEDARYSQTLYKNQGACGFIDLGVDDVAEIVPKELGRSLVFTGVMDYAPNEDAMSFFIKEVFPILKQAYADLTLYVVGKNPSESLLRLSQNEPSIHVTGYVESVYPYILGATVYISPLRYGTGVKNKVLEAMNCCKASVFSPISIEAIPEVKPNINCLIAESAEEWVASVSSLLDDPDKRRVLERNLANSAVTERSWAKALDELVSLE